MSKKFDALSEELIRFIEEQKIFFTGTAAADGRVNISPKGHDSLKVMSPDRLLWMNLTGSGNETAAHLLKNNRLTLMWCSFEGKPLILRVYGRARIYHPRDEQFNKYQHLFEARHGARQIIELTIDLVQTSCGFAVPLMDYREDREILREWEQKKGPQGIREYWENKNQESIDGFETKIMNE